VSKRPDTWMPLYIGDYLRKTMHLTIDQHGAYLMLIMACWCEGGILADNDERLAAICRVSTKRWEKLRPAVEKFFSINAAGWANKRVTEELAKAAGITEHRRNAGRASVAAKAQQTANKPTTSVATSVQQVLQQTDRPSPSQSEGEEGDVVSPRNPTTQKLKTLPLSSNETNSAREGEPLTEPVDPAIDDGESEESFGFKKISDPRGSLRSPAAVAALRRNQLIQKLIRFATATMQEPELSFAVGGLCGADSEHDEQWWLDHLDRLMRAQRWDDTARLSA